MQFKPEHWELGLKLLTSVDYYTQNRVLGGGVQLHTQSLRVLGHPNELYFASFSASPGRSGDEILPKYRLANHLTGASASRKFITLADLPRFIDDSNAKFVFVDDFVGSGKQAVETWKNIVGLVNPHHEVVLAVHVAFQEGLDYIQRETPLQVVCNRILTNVNKIFSSANSPFTADEKTALADYCNLAGEFPAGYQNMQANVVFYYRAPNNCISILRCNSRRWKGLFLRNP
jgi:hypothetical protein